MTSDFDRLVTFKKTIARLFFSFAITSTDYNNNCPFGNTARGYRSIKSQRFIVAAREPVSTELDDFVSFLLSSTSEWPVKYRPCFPVQPERRTRTTLHSCNGLITFQILWPVSPFYFSLYIYISDGQRY